MYKDVVVFYGPLPLSDLKPAHLISSGLSEKSSSVLYRAMINDLLAEYNPFLEDEYDFVYCYTGELNEFRSRYKYNFRRYIRDIGNGDPQIGLMYVHSLMARSYERVIIVGADSPMITKRMIKESFRALGDNHDAVIAPSKTGRLALWGMNGFEDVYSEDLIGWGDQRVFSTQSDLSANLVEACHARGIAISQKSPVFCIDSKVDLSILYQSITQNRQLLPEYSYLSRLFDAMQKYLDDLSIVI